MNETLLWLVFVISGGVAFAAIYYWRWRIVWAVLTGILITAIGWLLIFRFTDEEMRPDWIRVDLSLNLTLGLMFAVFGAAIGRWLLAVRSVD